MRADRLLSILLMLQTGGRITAQELAERLEVSGRTIYRDLDALSAAGIPVYAERGPGGGCALLEDYKTDLTGLNEAEIRTLFMSGAAGPLADLGLGRALEDALLKLLASLPSATRRDAERARQRLHLDAAGWNRPEEAVPHLRTIQEAVWQDRQLCLVYRRGDAAQAVERLVEPYGLVAKATVWYLVGASEGEVRVFRVSRMADARLTDTTFSRPKDFDLAAYWTEWCSQFKAGLPRYPVTLRVSPEGTNLLPHALGEGVRAIIERAGSADTAGWRTLSLHFESLENARSRLLGLGTTVEVIEPAELRESFLTLTRELAAFYAQPLPIAATSAASGSD